MKQSKIVIVMVSVILAGIAVVFAVLQLSERNVTDASAVDPCKGKMSQTHNVVVSGDQLEPPHSVAKLCDKLKITNADGVVRIMAFGQHSNHQAYDGVTQKTLGQNQSFSVTLTRAGTYIIHDHLDERVSGDFTVNQ